jgi:hypothetical protein
MAAKNDASDMTCSAIHTPRLSPSSSRMMLETEVANEKQRLIAATPTFRSAALSSLAGGVSVALQSKELGCFTMAGIERSRRKEW